MKLIKSTLAVTALILSLSSCSSTLKGRQILDRSSGIPGRPDWAEGTKVTWAKDHQLFIHAQHTIRGDQRINSCLDLARLDAKEELLSGISEKLAGEINEAIPSAAEASEDLLSKVRSLSFKGRLNGLSIDEQYFERYQIGETERIECHVLARISDSDYQKARQLLINEITSADPRIKEAILKKNIEFFSATSLPERTSASSTNEGTQ